MTALAAAVEKEDPCASRAGPRTLAEVVDLGARFWRALDEHDRRRGTDLWTRCEGRFAHGMVLTSKFSGMGGAETALSMLAGHRGHHVRMFSATDVAPLCRKVLLAHPSCSRSEHVFADVLDLVPQPALQDCSAAVRAKLEEWQARVEQARQTETGEKRKHHEVVREAALQKERGRVVRLALQHSREGGVCRCCPVPGASSELPCEPTGGPTSGKGLLD